MISSKILIDVQNALAARDETALEGLLSSDVQLVYNSTIEFAHSAERVMKFFRAHFFNLEANLNVLSSSIDSTNPARQILTLRFTHCETAISIRVDNSEKVSLFTIHSKTISKL